MALAVILVFGLCWFITAPMRTASRLQQIVGIQWTLTAVSHDGQTTRLPRGSVRHTFLLDPTGFMITDDGCNSTSGSWSWNMSGFSVDGAATTLSMCTPLSGSVDEHGESRIYAGEHALQGTVTAELVDSILTVDSDGYTLIYARA